MLQLINNSRPTKTIRSSHHVESYTAQHSTRYKVQNNWDAPRNKGGGGGQRVGGWRIHSPCPRLKWVLYTYLFPVWYCALWEVLSFIIRFSSLLTCNMSNLRRNMERNATKNPFTSSNSFLMNVHTFEFSFHIISTFLNFTLCARTKPIHYNNLSSGNDCNSNAVTTRNKELR